MADNDQSAQDGDISDLPNSAPPVGQADLDKFRQELMSDITKANDERFGGIQKLFAKRDSRLDNLTTTLEQLKSRSLTDEDREELESRASAERVQALEAENEILRISREYPEDVVSDFDRLINAETAREQMEILKSLRTPREQSSTPAANPIQGETIPEGIGMPSVMPASSEVDPNNPPAESLDGLAYEQAFERDPSLVDKILRGGRL